MQEREDSPWFVDLLYSTVRSPEFVATFLPLRRGYVSERVRLFLDACREVSADGSVPLAIAAAAARASICRESRGHNPETGRFRCDRPAICPWCHLRLSTRKATDRALRLFPKEPHLQVTALSDEVSAPTWGEALRLASARRRLGATFLRDNFPDPPFLNAVSPKLGLDTPTFRVLTIGFSTTVCRKMPRTWRCEREQVRKKDLVFFLAEHLKHPVFDSPLSLRNAIAAMPLDGDRPLHYRSTGFGGPLAKPPKREKRRRTKAKAGSNYYAPDRGTLQ